MPSPLDLLQPSLSEASHFDSYSTFSEQNHKSGILSSYLSVIFYRQQTSLSATPITGYQNRAAPRRPHSCSLNGWGSAPTCTLAIQTHTSEEGSRTKSATVSTHLLCSPSPGLQHCSLYKPASLLCPAQQSPAAPFRVCSLRRAHGTQEHVSCFLESTYSNLSPPGLS